MIPTCIMGKFCLVPDFSGFPKDLYIYLLVCRIFGMNSGLLKVSFTVPSDKTFSDFEFGSDNICY